MSCFHPLFVRFYDGKFSRFGGKLTSGTKPLDGEEIVPVPCGKCEGCRLDRSKRWADRMLLEFDKPSCGLPRRSALFLTLTYDDAHMPVVRATDNQMRGTLDLKDVQDFLKRLRKSIAPKKLRYFLAGEYGDTTFRPHYHMILFGLTMDDFPDALGWSAGEEKGTVNYLSLRLNSIWTKGNVLFSPANYKTFCYVARYVLKKQYGFDGTLAYRGRKPPFTTMSRCPGLGMAYFDDESQFNAASVFDGSDVRLVQRPRAAFDRLKDNDPYQYEVLSAERRELARRRHELVMSQTDMSFLEKLSYDEVLFSEKMKSLHKRNF